MIPTILLVRPANRLPADVAICRQFGWQALPFPPLNIEPLLDNVCALPEEIAQSDAVFWVSPTAVETADLDLSGSLKPHIAVGESTANALKQSGAAWVWYPETGHDSEAVLQLPIWEKLPKNARILIVRGEHGRAYLAEQLEERGYYAHCIDIYRREEQVLDWSVFREYQPYFAWVTSVQMVEILFAQVPTMFTQNLKSLIYFTHHSRIADALAAHGAEQVRIVKNLQTALWEYTA